MSDDPRMGGGVVARHAELIGRVTLMWSDVHGADKPFRAALRMEEKALEQGDIANHPKGSLRWNAQRLLMLGEPPSIKEVADRLDGKAAQESTVTVVKRDAEDWTRAELVALIRDARASGNGTAPPNGRSGGPDRVH